MRVLKLFLGKNIFLQISLKFKDFNVTRLDGPPLGSGRVRLSRPNNYVTHPDVHGSAE
jgi:hypothetical protein